VILESIFDLRSAEEHLNEWQTVVADGETASLRSVQAEVLACAVYLRLFEDAGLRAEFATDVSTQNFWGQRDDVTAARRTPAFDITEAEAGLQAAERLLD
jgi:hypothetical protein